MKNFTKFAVVAFVAFFAASVSAATLADFGTVNIKVGSKGPAVMAVQSALNVCQNSTLAVDGMFGPKTAQVFAAFQMAKGIKVDGIVGPQTKATLLACSTAGSASTGTGTVTTTNSNSVTLNGGEADLTEVDLRTASDTSIEEADEEKEIAQLRVKAEDGDAQIERIDFTFVSTAASDETRPWKTFEKLYLLNGSTEIGSVDVSDSDDWSEVGSTTPKTYRIRLSVEGNDAVVKEDVRATFKLAADLNDSVDIDAAGNVWTIAIDDSGIRYTDSTNAISTTDTDTANDSVTVTVNQAGMDDELKIKTSSNNPTAATLDIDETNSSDEHTVFKFKMEADEDGGDIKLVDGKVRLAITAPSAMTFANLIDEVTLKVGSEEYQDDVTTFYGANTYSGATVTSGTTAYATVSFDTDDQIIESGDSEEVSVMVKFRAQGTPTVLIPNGTTITASVENTEWNVEGTDDEVATVTGDLSGNIHTLREEGVTFELASATAVTTSYSVAGGADYVTYTMPIKITTDETLYLKKTYGLTAGNQVEGITSTISGATPVISAANTNESFDTSALTVVTSGGVDYYEISGTKTVNYKVILTGATSATSVDSVTLTVNSLDLATTPGGATTNYVLSPSYNFEKSATMRN